MPGRDRLVEGSRRRPSVLGSTSSSEPARLGCALEVSLHPLPFGLGAVSPLSPWGRRETEVWGAQCSGRPPPALQDGLAGLVPSAEAAWHKASLGTFPMQDRYPESVSYVLGSGRHNFTLHLRKNR